MEKEIFVYVDLNGTPHLTGRLWTGTRKNRESAAFEYDEKWLAYPNKFSLDPILKLGPGPFHAHPDKVLFGALGDSAPDRWGRVLMRRAERRRAERAEEMPRALQEIDYLLMVNDEAREGALRFAETEGGPFLATQGVTQIPPLIDLPKLLSAAEHVVGETESDEDLRLLLAPGSSLVVHVQRLRFETVMVVFVLQNFRIKMMGTTLYYGKPLPLLWLQKRALLCRYGGLKLLWVDPSSYFIVSTG